MDAEEVLSLVKLADDLVYANKQQRLDCAQREFLQGVLTGLKYKEIQADKTKELHHYSVSYLGGYVAYELWKLMTKVFQDIGVLSAGEKVNRNNVRAYLQRAIKQQLQEVELLQDKTIPIENEYNLTQNSKTYSIEKKEVEEIFDANNISLEVHRHSHTTHWIGREALIAEICHKLHNKCRILSLVGITGIGKTALAGRLTIEPAIIKEFPIVKLVSFESELPNFDAVARCILGDEIAADEVLRQSPEKLVAAMVGKLQIQPYFLILDMVEEVLKINSNGAHQFKESIFEQFLERVIRTDVMASRIVITSQYKIPVLAEGRHQTRTDIIRLAGLEETEALELFNCWGDNPATNINEVSLMQRLICAYEGHPLALKVIAGEIQEAPYYGDIQAYWHDYGQEIEVVENLKMASEECLREDKPRLDRYSINLTDLVKMRVEKMFNRLLESSPLACLMLCMGAKYRRAVERQAWLMLIDKYSEENSLMAFQALQRRFLLEEESTPHKVLYRLHSLIRRVALDNLPKIEDEVLSP